MFVHNAFDLFAIQSWFWKAPRQSIQHVYRYLKIWEIIFIVKREGGGIFLKSNHGSQITKETGCIPLGNKMILNAIIKNKSYFH